MGYDGPSRAGVAGPPSHGRGHGGMTVVSQSVAMAGSIDDALRTHLLREDGQEDVCLASYAHSTGATRVTSILTNVILPQPGERKVHGNATFPSEYVVRAASEASARGEGIA